MDTGKAKTFVKYAKVSLQQAKELSSFSNSLRIN